MQVIIDGISRVLLLHNRVSRSFQWTITSLPEDSELGNPEAAYSEADTASHFALSEITVDNSKGLPADTTSSNRLLDEMQQDNNNMMAREINSRLQRVEKLVENCKPHVIDESKNFKVLKLQWMGIALVLDRFSLSFI